MSSVNDFAAAAARIADTPQPFREILLQRIPKAETVRELIFSPAFAAGKFRALASVLCVTDRRWLVLLGQNDGRITVDEASYDMTLLLELTIILLYGQLRIDFVVNRETRMATLQFNAVMQPSYSVAIQDILDAIDEKEHAAAKRDWIRSSMVSGWPLKFRNLAIIYLPEKSRLLDAVYWKEIRGSFNRELGPATALMLTDRHIVLIAEEKGIGWFQFRRHTKHGAVITYFPLDRLVDFHIKAHKRFSILELDGCESQGRERIEVMIPTDKQEVVSRLIEKGAGPSPLQPLQSC
jgi:hypothetical protein